MLSDVDSIESPRVISTHLPWYMMPQQARDSVVKVWQIHYPTLPKQLYIFFSLLDPQTIQSYPQLFLYNSYIRTTKDMIV